MTVKHTLVSLDMRVFALCSLMELHRYEHSREKLIQLLSYGMRIEEIIAICSNTEIWQLVDCDCQYAS